MENTREDYTEHVRGLFEQEYGVNGADMPEWRIEGEYDYLRELCDEHGGEFSELEEFVIASTYWLGVEEKDLNKAINEAVEDLWESAEYDEFLAAFIDDIGGEYFDLELKFWVAPKDNMTIEPLSAYEFYEYWKENK